MKRIILFLSIFTIFKKINAGKFQGNLVFFGRGQRTSPKYWGDLNQIKVSKRSKVFYPYQKYDDDPTYTGSSDEAKNYPLSIFLPEIDSNNQYSEVRFEAERTDFLNLADFSYLNTELKIRYPETKYLISEGYTCQKLGLSCTEIDEYDFKKNTDWLKNIDLKIFLEDYTVTYSDKYSDEEKKKKSYELKNIEKPTIEWKELVGKIENIDKTLNYTSLIFRNYGKMPVYLSIGNTIFIKSEDEDIHVIKNGKFGEYFQNKNWYENREDHYSTVYSNKVCPLDSEKKNSIYCAAIENYTYGVKATIFEDVPTFGPPEAISFKYRTMQDDTLLNALFNEKLTLSINEYLNARGCLHKTQEEATILLDLKHYILMDSKNLMNNDVFTVWIQTVTDIEAIKNQILLQTKNETLSKAYVEELYFYDLTLHNKYPTNLEPYTLANLYTKENCDVSLHGYSYILSTKKRWPDDIKFEKMYNSKNIVIEYEDDIEDNNNNDTSDSKKFIYNYNFKFNISSFIITILYFILF